LFLLCPMEFKSSKAKPASALLLLINRDIQQKIFFELVTPVLFLRIL